ncbi:MAG: hypothetical protein ACR2QJ_02485 [Geminicoccaceae bacterium]
MSRLKKTMAVFSMIAVSVVVRCGDDDDDDQDDLEERRPQQVSSAQAPADAIVRGRRQALVLELGGTGRDDR